MKDVQCYELFGGIALNNHAFSFSFFKANITDLWTLTVKIVFNYVLPLSLHIY